MSINSPVDICNLALDHLKEAPISDIENPITPTEVICARWYDQSRKALLRKHPWNFATKRAALPQLAQAPAFEYSKQFQLPSDFLRLVAIGEFGTQKRYQLEDGKILTDDINSLFTDGGALPIRYIYNFTTVTGMDPLFIDLLAIELAMSISFQITGSNTRGQALMGLMKEMAPQAYAIDGQERPPVRIERSKSIRARKSHRTGSTALPYILLDD